MIVRFLEDSVTLKSNKCGITGVLWRALKKLEKEGDLLVITIDAFDMINI